MSRVTDDSPLAQTGFEYVVGMFKAQLTKPVDFAQVNFTISPATSQLTIAARNQGTDGASGKYIGGLTVAYQKADLTKVLPYPIHVDAPYGTSWHHICEYALEQFNIVLEDGEFTQNGTVMQAESWLSTIPNGITGTRFIATANSARWITGTYVDVIFVPSNQAGDLRWLVDVRNRVSLSLLELPTGS